MSKLAMSPLAVVKLNDPLTVFVLSSKDMMTADLSLPLASKSSIAIAETLDIVPLLNLTFPLPGSAIVVVVLKLYDKTEADAAEADADAAEADVDADDALADALVE